VGKTDEKRPFKDLSVDGSVILKRVFKKWDGETCIGLIRFRMGTGGGLL